LPMRRYEISCGIAANSGLCQYQCMVALRCHPPC
jgi:hypothetical protein